MCHIVSAWHNKTMMTLQNLAVLTFVQHISSAFIISPPFSLFLLFLSSSFPSFLICSSFTFLLPRCNRVTCCRSDPFKERRELRWAVPLRSDQSCQRGGAYCVFFSMGRSEASFIEKQRNVMCWRNSSYTNEK